jgi:hypothetical protein
MKTSPFLPSINVPGRINKTNILGLGGTIDLSTFMFFVLCYNGKILKKKKKKRKVSERSLSKYDK